MAPLRSAAVTSEFARDTAVEALGGGRYAGRIEPGWRVERPNGGYLAALVLRAVTAELGNPARAPRSLTVHYLRSPDDGPVEVAVTVERSGRTMSTVAARLVQNGRLVVVALVAAGTTREGFTYRAAPMPAVPTPEDCPPIAPPPFPIPLRDRFESRHAIGPLPGTGADEAVTGGWIRLADPEPTDAHVLAQLADAWVPAVFGVTRERLVVPTVDLTVHFRQAPVDPDPWLLVQFRSTFAAEGYLEEDGAVWDRSGRLLALSRQLAVLV